MISKLGKLFLALCFLTVGGGMVANAQIDTGITVRGDVPFAFVVGDTTLPAGKYDIRAMSDMPGVLELRSDNRRTAVFVDAESMDAKLDRIPTKSELVFDKVGDNYFLRQVWVAGGDTGSELVKARMEKRLETGGARAEQRRLTAILRRLKP